MNNCFALSIIDRIELYTQRYNLRGGRSHKQIHIINLFINKYISTSRRARLLRVSPPLLPATPPC